MLPVVRHCGRPVLAMAVLLLAGPVLAQPLQTVPGSSDPLLRVTPIERERIRPEPTPGLDVRSLPGRQAVVLRAQPHPDRPARPPVVLQLPAALFERTTARASEQWFIYFMLRYPQMLPWHKSGPDCLGFCQGMMMLSLNIYPQPIPQFEADRVRAELRNGATMPEAERLRVITPVEPLPGYTEAYEEFLPTRAAPQLASRDTIYIRERDGVVDLFTRCATSARFPACKTSFQARANPMLTVSFTIAQTHLGELVALQQQIADWVDASLVSNRE